MVSSGKFALLAAAGLAAGLLLAEPAWALTAMAHPTLIGFDQARLDALQPVGYRPCRGHREGWHGCRHDRPRRYDDTRRRSGSYAPRQRETARRTFPGGPYKPWEGFEPCAHCPAFK
jgi:hypothetical protein